MKAIFENGGFTVDAFVKLILGGKMMKKCSKIICLFLVPE